MINRLQKIMPKARKAVEILFDDICTIYTYEQINIPCRMSFSNFPSAVDGEQAKITQGIKLFINPEIKISAGSFISINRQGITTDYACTGQPAIYKTHQEINLELYKEYA